ncbi:amidase [Tsukamurella sp. 8F]|uniref:amidase n=1 Tax=unclassified Tsukamurella TaxID=2633480 RepID=UPI0023B9A697|nr:MULTISPECIES: amidase [unclassified Tsukamurella]MDF0528961.1 amidase [Tsukamurella sp. 8J]MDF0587334.1 amidase [Tsukamurella sp. 8F]
MSIATTLSDAAAALAAGTTTSTELVTAAIAVADAHDEQTGMFLSRFTDQALAAAAAADADRAAGREPGALAGIPIGIKDIITTSEAPSTAQSLVLDPAWSHGDAVVVQRLRDAGAIILGKLTTMEFAIGSPDATKPFPIPRNPWNLQHWTGGSSSGSGSAVAAGAVLGALGTDTGGSIRIPAAFCGITGLMPTFGRVPKSGCVPLGYSLDHIGPMARSARDCATMLTVLAGHHPSDHTAIDTPTSDYTTTLTGDLTGLRIGVDRLARYALEDEDPALPRLWDDAMDVLRARGARIVDIELPFYEEMTIADLVIMFGEALAYHRGDLQTRWGDYFAATRTTVGSGIFYGGADYVQAQRCRRVGQQALAELYADVDVIATPTSSTAAPSYADMDGFVEALASGTTGAMHTGYWDTTGNPVLCVPIGFNDAGLPMSMQLAGRPFEEATVLRVGDAYQAASDWHLRSPAMTPTAAEVPA